MHKKQRWVFVLVLLLSLCAVGFLSAALGTDFWLEAHPVRNVNELTEDGARNVTEGDTGTKFNGFIHFGLFHGQKSLDHGLGLREGEIWIECLEAENLCGWVWGSYTQQRQEQELLTAIDLYEKRISSSDTNNVVGEVRGHGLFNFGLWLSTIVMVCLAIIWGLICMGFAALNAATRPIETITGPMGLYLWSSLAGVFSLAAIIIFVVLYYVDLKQNVLTEEDIVDLWSSEDRTSLSYSFYFVVVSAILYSISLLVIGFGGIQCATVKYGKNLNDKAMDGVMMY